jgi:caffeoyl-CoA O-methyltransferase
MFHKIPKPMLERMRALEAIDAADRNDGTAHALRLRQIPPATGKFLAIIAASAPEGDWIEVGTSAGYSALWLSLACKAKNKRLTTYELAPKKAAMARKTFALTGANACVELVEGDALMHVEHKRNLAFCFLDAERKLLPALFDLIVPRLVAGGLICVDNVISHAHEVADFLRSIESDSSLDTVIVPIGSGVLLCRKP